MNRPFCKTIWFLLLACLLFACGENDKFSKLADFSGQRIASQTGTIFDDLIAAAVPNAHNVYFDDLSAQILALKTGKVVAIALDEPVARFVVAQNPELMIFPTLVFPDHYGFALRKNNQELTKNIQKVVAKLRDSGELAKLAHHWMNTVNPVKIEIAARVSPEAKLLRFGYDPEVIPMIYLDSDGKVTGYEIALLNLIAQELNLKLELVYTNFTARIETLLSGKIDLAGGAISITPEREKRVDFVEIHAGGGCFVINKKDWAGK